MKRLLFTFSLLALGFSACSKYTEGPNFSLQTKKSRLCNDWELTDHVLNGNNIYNAAVTSKMSIDKDGTYSMSNFTNELGQLQGTYSHGTWKFGEDATTLFLYADTTTINPVHEYTIKELRSKRMVLEEEIFQTGDLHRVTFSQQ
ncbi:MAG: hypothetical protein RLZZ321_1289 [Bacteroidota bacterium]|jgi:hypothetical protein